MKKIDRSIKKLELVNQWISNVDTKSSFVLTFYGIITTIIFSTKIGEEMFDVFSYKIATEINYESIKLFCCLLIVIGFFTIAFFTFYYIYQTLKGRVNPTLYQESGLKTDSNLFFGTIASKSYSDFERQTNTENKAGFLQDINSQVFINSNIADSKFKYYNKSLIWLMCSFMTFVLFMLVK